ncbi:hypothetical protein Pdw03_7825 [Penicillium digitatum]|uniref:Uncharacterized protein n=1 Tax=Penicillium digitatum TaxID=36651 RepID=A0A7T7BL83_PENDI|nr:hypothetical protein Pdw03_7825 [Penicillium digitatum]
MRGSVVSSGYEALRILKADSVTHLRCNYKTSGKFTVHFPHCSACGGYFTWMKQYAIDFTTLGQKAARLLFNCFILIPIIAVTHKKFYFDV